MSRGMERPVSRSLRKAAPLPPFWRNPARPGNRDVPAVAGPGRVGEAGGGETRVGKTKGKRIRKEKTAGEETCS